MKNLTKYFPAGFMAALILALVVFAAPKASAQSRAFVFDPLKKPHIWVAIKKNPDDDELWSEYFGKPLDELDEESQKKHTYWKKTLKNRIDYKLEQNKEQPMQNAKHLNGWLKMLTQERDELKHLKSNVSQNFLLIEEVFSSLYNELELEYKFYDVVHPSGNYNKVKWVEEHEAAVDEVKKQKLSDFKAVYNIKN